MLKLLRQAASNSIFLLSVTLVPLTAIAIFAILAWHCYRVEVSIFEFALQPFLMCFCFALVILSLVHGWGRATVFHPICDEKYCEWLERTPWTPNHPLPKGPPHPTRWDGCFEIVFTLLYVATTICMKGSIDWWKLMVCPFWFSVGLTAGWTLVNCRTAQWKYVLLAAVTLPLVALLPIPLIGLFIALPIMMALSWQGVRRGLYDFPWKNLSIAFPDQRKRNLKVGWPYRDLLVKLDDHKLPARQAAILGLVAGLWGWFVSYPFQFSLEPENELKPLLFPILPALFLIQLEMHTYGYALCSHLCWGQRVGLGRWIVPKHDVIFLSSIAIAFSAVAIPWLLYQSSLPVEWAVAVGIGLEVFSAFGIGPKLDHLRHTGVHAMSG